MGTSEKLITKEEREQNERRELEWIHKELNKEFLERDIEYHRTDKLIKDKVSLSQESLDDCIVLLKKLKNEYGDSTYLELSDYAQLVKRESDEEVCKRLKENLEKRYRERYNQLKTWYPDIELK